MAKGFYRSWFYKLMSGQLTKPGQFANFIGSYLSNAVDSLIKSATGSGMTNASKEEMDYQLSNQQILNDEEYQRKIDFYERYESYEAQVNQMKSAGLNPALMYGSGPSVSASGGIGSAGSASSADAGASFGSILGLISTLSQVQQRRDAVDKETALSSDANDIRREEVAVQRLQAENYGAYLKALTTGQNNENAVFFEMFGLKKREIEVDVSLKEEQKNYFAQVCSSEEVRRRLMESGVKLNDVNAAATQIQKAILLAQEKYSDQYFKALADYQSAQALMAGVESSIFEKTTEQRLRAAQAELNDIVIRTAMDAHILDGSAFMKAVQGDLTKKEWVGVWSSLISSVIGAGAVLGGAAIRGAARAVTPVSPWGGGYSPYVQNQFYEATGTRMY